MSLQVLPVRNTPNQQFTALLEVDGVPLTVNVHLSYNEMAGYWIMAIFDINNNLLIDSVPVLTGSYPAANLLEQQRYMQIGSWYVINLGNIYPTTLEGVGYGQGPYGGGPYGGQQGQGGEDYPDDSNLGIQFQMWVSDTPLV